MKIGTTGMEGFSESGSPGGWDLGIGEVYGYRWWKMRLPAGLVGFRTEIYADNDEGIADPLEGANRKRWTGGRNEAVCEPYSHFYGGPMPYAYNPHYPPEYREPCGCGFWAYFEPQLSPHLVLGGIRKGVPSRVGFYVHIPVLGVIRGTGRVIIGDQGFRSQYAEIVGLALSDWAVENLSYDVSPLMQGQEAGTSAYGRLFAALKGNVATNGGYVVSEEIDEEGPEVREAARTLVMRRIAMAETILEASYPQARILCDQGALVKYFGYDKNYGPGSAFALDNEYGS